MRRRKKTDDGTYDIRRPPQRVYISIDELGPARANVRKSEAIADAECEAPSFGDTMIYEYRLVDARPRAEIEAARVKAATPERRKQSRRGVRIKFTDSK